VEKRRWIFGRFTPSPTNPEAGQLGSERLALAKAAERGDDAGIRHEDEDVPVPPQRLPPGFVKASTSGRDFGDGGYPDPTLRLADRYGLFLVESTHL
jgi:hypothetical protein